MTSRLMADVSSNNGHIDVAEYARAGHIALAIKASEGGDYVNPFHRGWSLQAGMHHLAVLHYHFARPDAGGSPETEAHHFIAATDGLRGARDYLVLDYERSRGGGLSADVEWVQAFDRVIRELTRFRLILYMSASELAESDAWLAASPPRAWVAEWSSAGVTVPHGWALVARQFTNGVLGPEPHELAGIGRCDVSYLSHGLYEAIRRRD